jgi:hypothetical protein
VLKGKGTAMRTSKAAQAPLQLSLLNTLPPNLQRQPLQPLTAPNVQREALSNDSITISVGRWQAKPKKKAAAKEIKEKRDKDRRHSNRECMYSREIRIQLIRQCRVVITHEYGTL